MKQGRHMPSRDALLPLRVHRVLDSTSLSGTLPTNLSSLTKMQYLYVPHAWARAQRPQGCGARSGEVAVGLVCLGCAGAAPMVRVRAGAVARSSGPGLYRMRMRVGV